MTVPNRDALRILYAHPAPFPGTEANRIQAAESCRALAERGHEVFLLVSRLDAPSGDECLERLMVSPHPRLHVIEEPAIRLKNTSGIRSVMTRASLLFYLRALVKKGKTVLYFRTLRDSRMARFMLFASRWLGVPVIYEAHKIYSDKRREQGFHAGSLKRIDRLESRVLDRANGVVASHPLLADDLRSRFRPGGELEVIPNGVRVAEEKVGEPEFDAVYSGSLFSWKGVDLCLDAVSKIEGCRLAIVGGNPADRLAELQERCRKLEIVNRVKFFGQLSRSEALDVVMLSRSALVTLEPGYWEGERYTCPLKMFEAMMRGVPVIAADMPAIRALTEGKGVRLYPPGDAAGLAHELKEVLSSEATAGKLSREGRALALEFTNDKRAAKVEGFAHSLLR